MFILGTQVKVADNSGAKVAQCLKVLGGSGRKVARTGDRVVVSIQALRGGARARSKVTKGSLH